MSTEDFSKKSDKLRKELNVLRKDINYRDEQQKRGEATYTLDAEINGQFNTITETLGTLEMMVNNFRNNFKDYNLTISQANKRYKVYEQLLNEKNTLKRNYDALFQKKTTQRELFAAQTHGKDTFDQKYEVNKLSTNELHTIKGKQEEDQEQILDELIQNVRGLKGGQHAIKDELTEHQKLLGELDNKLDGNIDNMGKARRRLSKLLDKSSNCCLVTVMILEIVAIVAIWMFL